MIMHKQQEMGICLTYHSYTHSYTLILIVFDSKQITVNIKSVDIFIQDKDKVLQ